MELKPLIQLSLTLMVGAGLVYYGLDIGAPKEDANLAHSGPVAIIDNMDAWQTDNSGKLLRQFSGQQLRQYETPERYEIDEPRITLFRDGQTAWFVRSDRATSTDPKQDIRLIGNVQADRDPQLGTQLRLNTSLLNANPSQDRLFTDEQVIITGQQGRITGRGLDTDLKAGTLSLSSAVEVRYAPNN
jgi:LPS export ABC transporter protein LptC